MARDIKTSRYTRSDCPSPPKTPDKISPPKTPDKISPQSSFTLTHFKSVAAKELKAKLQEIQIQHVILKQYIALRNIREHASRRDL